MFAQNFLRHGAGGDAPDGLPRAGASAALPIADAEFGLVGVVGVGWPEFRRHFAVGAWPGILILDEHGNGCADGLALERAGKDLHPVGLLARSDDGGLARAAAVQIGLDIGFRQRQARRAAVNYNTDAPSVRFPPSGNAKQVSK